MIDDNDNNGGLQLVGVDFCWEEVLSVAAYTIIYIEQVCLGVVSRGRNVEILFVVALSCGS